MAHRSPNDMLISNEFGQYFARLPLKKSVNIVHGNALEIEWETVFPKEELSFIIGNPPFLGKSNQNVEQKKDLEIISKNVKGAGVLDYVSAWYLKAAQFIQNTKIKVGFVSTKSIAQGEQVGILWNLLFNHYKIKIHFVHTELLVGAMKQKEMPLFIV
ncbi:methylase of polypeptide subunit release factors [Chryseobacterium sp. MP_3.2]|nr:methylase of polypeptide subunit release factors [Chryseobacterium sp. MP_3.2]